MQTLEKPETIAFGPFVLDLGSRALSAGGEKLQLSSRAFDILVFLVTERDRVVGKDEIMSRVWRGVAVEENNLAVQISALRRVLGEHAEGQTLIATIPGQGYRFVGRVEMPASAPAALPTAPPAQAPFPHDPAPALKQHRRWAMPAGIASLGLVAVLLGSAFLSRQGPAPRLSLAVLPFRNLGADTSQDYLADAISDDLTTDLSHLPGSVVIARESSDVYKGRAVPAEQIGRALRVRYLLEGSLRDVEGRFHINAQLIDATNGAHLWADGFDVQRDKLGDAQAAIVGHIANALNVELVAIESTRSLHERPSNPDALDLYFRARSLHDGADSLAKLRQAQAMLEQALVLQPEFLDAITELGLVLISKIHDFDDPDDSKDHEQAQHLAELAQTLAPNTEPVLTLQGLLKTLDGNVREGQASLQAALAMDANNVPARAGLAQGDWFLGKPEAVIKALTEVFRLDPQGPGTLRFRATLGMAYFMTGRWQDAIDWLLRAEAIETGVSDGGLDRLEWEQLFLMAAYDRAGDAARAKAGFAKYMQRWPHRSIWRLSSYFHKAQVAMPGFAAWQAALRDLGMPDYAAPSGKAASPSSCGKQDFDDTPVSLPNSSTLGVAEIADVLARTPKPLVLDVGIGAATLPGAVWVPDMDATIGGLEDALHRAGDLSGKSVIIVGDGFYGAIGCNAAARVSHYPFRTVFWLRGGEEALVQAGARTIDRRPD